MAVKKSALVTIYHVKDGPQRMYEVDARHALRFGNEWSETPWKTDGVKAEKIVEIPADWQDMTPMQRIALAAKLGAERKGLTASKADDHIVAEIERRENEPAEEPARLPAVQGRKSAAVVEDDDED
jgi:hypothetical protein